MNENLGSDITESYDPVMHPEMRRHVNSKEGLARATLSDTGKAILSLESTIIDISPDEDPSAFVHEHNRNLISYERDLQERLPTVNQEVIEKLATYISGGDAEVERQLIAEFEDRLESVQKIYVTDPYIDLPENGVATFSRESRAITVSGYVYMGLHNNDERKDVLLNKIILPHELLHGLLTSHFQENAIDVPATRNVLNVRNGLGLRFKSPDEGLGSSTDVIDFGSWVNEAFLEDLRSEIMETEEVGYTLSVTILRLVKQLDPDLKSILEEVAFHGRAPGDAIGRLELQFGPQGVEIIEDALTAIYGDPEWQKANETDQIVAVKKIVQSLIMQFTGVDVSEMFDSLYEQTNQIEV